MDHVRTMSRQELFDLVWERPISVVAPELDISGPGLKKLCERNSIPVPERGYWAKLQHGKRVRRKPPLPAPKPGQRDVVIIKKRAAKPPMNESGMPSELATLLALERGAVQSIPMPMSPKPHPLVAAWPKPQKPAYGVADWSPAAESRRRKIASVLFREVERRGGTIEVQNATSFTFSLIGQKVDVRLRERLRKVVVPGDKNATSYWERDDRTQWHPTGLLQFKIENFLDVPIRREFNEAAESTLELKLRDMIVAWLVAVEAERQYRAQIAEQRRRFDEERQAAEARREQARREREEEAQLLSEAQAFANATVIRSFVEAAISNGSRDTKWARWARDVADRMDPCMHDAEGAGQERYDDD